MVGLVEIHSLFTRRVSGFGRVCFRSVGLAGGSDICTTLLQSINYRETHQLKFTFINFISLVMNNFGLVMNDYGHCYELVWLQKIN